MSSSDVTRRIVTQKMLQLKIIVYFCGIIRDVAQPGSVHVWGACGRWFKSSHPDNRWVPRQESTFFC